MSIISGIVPSLKGTWTIKIDLILSYYTPYCIAAMTSPLQIHQLVRAFLFCLLGSTLFSDAASSIDLIYLMPLQDLALVLTYDWGSIALSYLYHAMDSFIHRAKRLCGF